MSKSQVGIHEDVTALNMRLFALVREVARVDPHEAMVRFGLERDLLDTLANAPLGALEELAGRGKLRFRPTINVQDVIAASRRATAPAIEAEEV